MDPFSGKCLLGGLKVDELTFAKGAPIGGAEEEQQEAIRAAQRLQSLLLATLVAEIDGWYRNTVLKAWDLLREDGKRGDEGEDGREKARRRTDGYRANKVAPKRARPRVSRKKLMRHT